MEPQRPKPTTVLRKPIQAERAELALMKSKGTPSEVLRASFILGLSEDSGSNSPKPESSSASAE